MRRDPSVLLMAVVESADATADAVEAISFDDYCNSRLIRAAVERESFATSSPMNTTGLMMHLFGVSFKRLSFR